MNFASTKERILQYIDAKGVSVAKFLADTEIKRGFLDGDKLKGSVSDVFLTKIIATYGDLNLEWLVTGRGHMLKGSDYGFPVTESKNDTFQEPKEDYSALEKQNPVIIAQTKTIEILEREVADLREDKIVLRDLIRAKAGKAQAS